MIKIVYHEAALGLAGLSEIYIRMGLLSETNTNKDGMSVRVQRGFPPTQESKV